MSLEAGYNLHPSWVLTPSSWQQRSPRTRPWLLGLSAPTLLFFILWPFVVQWLFRQFRTQKR